MSAKQADEVTKKASVQETADTQAPISIMTAENSYIADRMKSQPKSFEDLETAPRMDVEGIHRLSLPEFFESLSYDCTRGVSCPHHKWSKKKVMFGLEKSIMQWDQNHFGKYIFRWLSKKKQALDRSLDVMGWSLVNRSFGDFKNAPRTLFTINGGVENGDAILGFMHCEKGKHIRKNPSVVSQDRVKSEATKHETDKNFYKAKLDSESADPDFAPSGALIEDRDFDKHGNLINK